MEKADVPLAFLAILFSCLRFPTRLTMWAIWGLEWPMRSISATCVAESCSWPQIRLASSSPLTSMEAGSDDDAPRFFAPNRGASLAHTIIKKTIGNPCHILTPCTLMKPITQIPIQNGGRPFFQIKTIVK